ncbi:Putative HLH DNA-binding domain superfamily protein [Zea mays]|uniref:Putative HLH DNA-binding domain superfamily protein n=1 Tax=Zea mays TaxID=4577 RepID=A0A1D6J7A3_MAIZE|nr:Putative HLH DNA-binding domain superfamily protein [Zea mays]
MDMEDSGQFMQWAMATLQHDEDQAVDYPIDDGRGGATFPSLRALREASSQAAEMIQEPLAAANSRCGGDGGTAAAGNNISGTAPRRSSSGSAVIQPLRWNFGAGAAAPPGRDGVPVPAEAAATGSLLPDLAYGPPPTRKQAVLKSVGSIYAQDHIIAERKRREKINQRFIELSTVIPGLKKMDKATILSDATRYVRDLQEKIKAHEDGGGSNDRGIVESWVLVKKPCVAAPDEDAGSSPSWDSSGTTAPSPATNPLPEIEARFLNKNVTVRIHCVGVKGVVVRVLAELEELHLSIIHANVDEGFTVTAEEIVGRLKTSACINAPAKPLLQ